MGEGGETRHEVQSRKPLLASTPDGASGSGGSPERSAGDGRSGGEGKEAIQNHADNPAVRREKGFVLITSALKAKVQSIFKY